MKFKSFERKLRPEQKKKKKKFISDEDAAKFSLSNSAHYMVNKKLLEMEKHFQGLEDL